MIVVSQIRLSLEEDKKTAILKAIKKARLKEENIVSSDVSKVSVDARKNEVHFVYSVVLYTNIDEQRHIDRLNNKDVNIVNDNEYIIKKVEYSGERPVIIGFGPAGMFAGLVLAKAGMRPIILEKGADIDKRVKIVDNFWKNGVIDENTNVQFGEGGAGTFSDGKLVTRIKDPRCHYVLKKFIDFGAPKEIAYKAKPHIGTDKLQKIVKTLREEIIKLGGEVRFETEVIDFSINNGKIDYVLTKEEKIKTDKLILAIGHSSREMFQKIYSKNISIEAKAFSVGVRVEHLQTEIDKALFKDYANHKSLPKGEYQLSHKKKDGRAVYSFCMCPGGFVVPSSSSNGEVVVNGMSEYLRDGKNANAGIVVAVTPDDFGKNPLDGVAFQEKIEKKAFEYKENSYKAPAQTMKNFLNNKAGLDIKRVTPSYEIGIKESNLHDILPKFVTDTIKEGFSVFDKRLKGFSADDTILTGVETRTSSPVRILRNENYESISVKGLYPAGEGPGYAGGIMSAAVDGMKVAESIIESI